jgi:hypothetical protein
MHSYEELDPFKAVPLRYGDINQYQPQGLDDETREKAMEAVRRAIFDTQRRTVFYLDKVITGEENYLNTLKNPSAWDLKNQSQKLRDQQIELSEAEIERLMEEMLARGPG